MALSHRARVLTPGGAFLLPLLGLAAVATTLALIQADHGREARSPFRPTLDRCAERHGVVAAGPFGERYCRIKLADGGRPCTDGSQCLGKCITEIEEQPQGLAGAGACQRENLQFGCHTWIVHGSARSTLCVD